MRGVTRSGAAVSFWQCEPAHGFVFAGYFTGDPLRMPHMWRRDGRWRESGEPSALDLMFNDSK